MKRWWRRRTVRVRLAIWYAATLLVILALYGAGVFAFVAHNLSAEVDHRLREDFEVAENLFDRSPDGAVYWRRGHHDAEDEDEARIWAGAWSLDGMQLGHSDMPEWAAALPAPRAGMRGDIREFDVAGHEAVRVLDGISSIQGGPVLLRVIRPTARLTDTLSELALIELLALPAGVAIAALGGYALARRALAPIAEMAARARTIRAERLNERLPAPNPEDELGRLATVFNETFARLEQSFAQLRRFTADASHELRTPLTSLRSVGEVALEQARDPAACRDAIASMLEEIARLERLVESLLTLSRADAGRFAVHRHALALNEFAYELAHDFAPVAEAKAQVIVTEFAAVAPVNADRELLYLAVSNLLNNAVKYSPAGGRIRFAARQEGDTAVLELTDQGPGIAPEHLPHIFERFYRVDMARSRDAGGTGLGLAIAQWAVGVHGGHIEVESTVGRGATFRIRLPVE